MSNDPERPLGDPSVEQRESELPQKAFLIYRSNNLYDSLRQDFVHGLTDVGYQVVEYSFPEGTPEEEIARWAEEHAAELTGHQIIYDDTFKRSLEGQRPLKDRVFSRNKRYCTLDKITDLAAAKIILGASAEMTSRIVNYEHEESPELTRQAVVAILKRILRNPKNVPQHVLVLTSRLLEHNPFYRMDMVDKPLDVGVREAAQLIVDWLEEGGIARDSIEVRDKFTDDVAGQFNNGESWIIGDRHYIKPDGAGRNTIHSSEGKEYPHKAKLLQVPMSNFYLRAQQERLLEVDSDELKGALSSTIREMKEAYQL